MSNFQMLCDLIFSTPAFVPGSDGGDFLCALSANMLKLCSLGPDYRAEVIVECKRVLEILEKGTMNGKPVPQSILELYTPKTTN